jgi:hypothetical protein
VAGHPLAQHRHKPASRPTGAPPQTFARYRPRTIDSSPRGSGAHLSSLRELAVAGMRANETHPGHPSPMLSLEAIIDQRQRLQCWYAQRSYGKVRAPRWSEQGAQPCGPVNGRPMLLFQQRQMGQARSIMPYRPWSHYPSNLPSYRVRR